LGGTCLAGVIGKRFVKGKGGKILKLLPSGIRCTIGWTEKNPPCRGRDGWRKGDRILRGREEEIRKERGSVCRLKFNQVPSKRSEKVGVEENTELYEKNGYKEVGWMAHGERVE